MGKIAFVFSGQGAQAPGMGKELYECSDAAKAVFELCDGIRPGTSEQCFNGTKEKLTVTANTQPDMFAVEVAAARALVEAGIQPDALAGFSLGEISALAFSGAVSLEDGFKLVCRRGELMQEASNAADSAMVAVVKLPPEKVEELAGQFDQVYPVDYNSPAPTRLRRTQLQHGRLQGGGQSGRRPCAAPEGERCIPLPLHVLRRQGSGRGTRSHGVWHPKLPALF